MHECPGLQPLLLLGRTSSHAISTHSAALDSGANVAALTVDQRGAPRESGLAADIGSVELQPGAQNERFMANGFDGICDR
jgi:hypothetical protein